MNKAHYLTSDDVKHLKRISRRVLGGSTSHKTPKRRRYWVPSGQTATGAMAMLVADVPAATLNGGLLTASPGIVAGGATLMDWKQDVDGNYILPPTDLERVKEDDGNGGEVDAVRDAVNFSKTTIRASTGEPLLACGYEFTIEGDSGEEKVFIIGNVMDFRALPGFAKGTAPSGADDPDLQIPYHSGGAADFELSSDDCTGGA